MKENINRTAEKRKKQDQEYPGEFISGFFILVQNVDTNDNA
jgi:hypothetical protein